MANVAICHCTEPPSTEITTDKGHDWSRVSDAEHLVVGIMQMMASNESLAGNLAKAEAYAREAKSQGADIVVRVDLLTQHISRLYLIQCSG